MDELVVRVLTVGAGLTPHDRAGVPVHRLAVERDRLPVALHLELLEVRREPGEVLAVGEDRLGLRAEEARVPDVEQPEHDRHVGRERRSAQVLVDGVEPGEHLGELLGADRDHEREADRGVERVAATDPVPELEHVRRVDPELGDLLGVRRDRDEVLGDGRVVAAEAGQQPVARGPRVGEGLERAERLRAHDEEGLLGIEPAHRLPEVVAVDVAHEPELEVALREGAQRVVGHGRAEVGAADADVHDVADALPVCPVHAPGAHAVGEVGHPAEDGVHVGDDVDAVDLDARPFGSAQRDVEHGAVLGDVDVLAREHRVDAIAQPGPLGEREQQRHRLVGDQVLRVVDVEAVDFEGQAVASVGVAGEQVAQVHGADIGGVGDERVPLGRLVDAGRHASTVLSTPFRRNRGRGTWGAEQRCG